MGACVCSPGDAASCASACCLLVVSKYSSSFLTKTIGLPVGAGVGMWWEGVLAPPWGGAGLPRVRQIPHSYCNPIHFKKLTIERELPTPLTITREGHLEN